MSQSFYGFPNILGLLRATNLWLTGKAGATAGAGLAGGTTSGAPTSGQFAAGEGVFGQDGSVWICTVAGSPGTFTQVGTLVDPLTTRGDIIRRGASATQRLALGSVNQVLQSDGTDVLWGAAPPGGGGALTQLAQSVLSGTAASITFSSIPGSYSGLLLEYVASNDTATTAVAINAQFNGDTGANYDNANNISLANNTTSNGGTIGGTSARVGIAMGTGAPANTAGYGWLRLPFYAATTYHKGYTAHDARKDSNATSGMFCEMYSGFWRSTAAITTIKLFPNTGNFSAGTAITLYGLS